MEAKARSPLFPDRLSQGQQGSVEGEQLPGLKIQQCMLTGSYMLSMTAAHQALRTTSIQKSRP